MVSSRAQHRESACATFAAELSVAVPQNYEGTGLWQRMYDSFGHLNIIGYMGYKYPVVLGETGSKFVAGTSDIQSMADIQAWVAGKPNTGTAHNAANVSPLLACSAKL